MILVAILVFTVLAFIITNNGSGHNVSGLRYKEYQLKDYSSWFLKQLNNTDNWKRLKSCLVKSEDCNNLAKQYKTLKQYKMAKLTPIEAGCCRPPSECGYPVVNASYYDLSFHPVSSNEDCKLYKNSRVVKCYNCDSCKAGVAQYMKTEWRVVAIFNLALFVVLSIIYFVGCCARRNAGRTRQSKVWKSDESWSNSLHYWFLIEGKRCLISRDLEVHQSLGLWAHIRTEVVWAYCGVKIN